LIFLGLTLNTFSQEMDFRFINTETPQITSVSL